MFPLSADELSSTPEGTDGEMDPTQQNPSQVQKECRANFVLHVRERAGRHDARSRNLCSAMAECGWADAMAKR